MVLLNSLELGGTLLGKDCLDGGVSLVCTLRLTYLDEVVVPSVDADWMCWIGFVLWNLEIDALSH